MLLTVDAAESLRIERDERERSIGGGRWELRGEGGLSAKMLGSR
jgi:hypothetical protein